MNVCLSHQVTTTLVNTLGTDHDKPVIDWRDHLAKSLGCSIEVSVKTRWNIIFIGG